MHFSQIITAAAFALSLPYLSTAGTTCSKGNCGWVLNNSPWDVAVTKVENEDKQTDSAPDRCAFDNWNIVPPRAQTVWCKQIVLRMGYSAGARNKKDDVDGLTFNGVTWYFNGNKKTKGRWQKIYDGTKVKCWKKDNKPWCEDGQKCYEDYC